VHVTEKPKVDPFPRRGTGGWLRHPAVQEVSRTGVAPRNQEIMACFNKRPGRRLVDQGADSGIKAAGYLLDVLLGHDEARRCEVDQFAKNLQPCLNERIDVQHQQSNRRGPA